MWLLTAVGPVHGQREFTFVLEKNKSYSIGREKGSDICYTARTVHPKAGTVEVGDWDPTNHNTPPSIVWKVGKKKDGSFLPTKTLHATGDVGSTDKETYKSVDQASDEEIPLESGTGIQLAADSWFTVRWQHLHFSFDRMKNEDEDFTAGLRNCCVSWTASFQAADPPQVVVSGAYKSSPDCYFAVCYGVPIASEQWMYALSGRLRACWKKIADSQDSFSLPDPLDDRFRPPMDPSLRNAPASPEFWLTRPENVTLFSGWRVLGLKGTKVLADKRYYVAMGAEWDELDVLKPVPQSTAEFLERIAPVVEASQQAGQQLFVMYLPSLKADLENRNTSFESVIAGACASRGIFLTSGIILWRSVIWGGPQRFFELSATKGPDTSAATADVSMMPTSSAPPQPAQTALPAPSEEPPSSAIPPSSIPEPEEAPPPERTGRLTRRAASRAASRAPWAPPTAQPDVIPSTFADETAAKPTATKEALKKPLKRRAGCEAKADTFDDLDMCEPSQPSLLFQPSHIPDTQGSQTSSASQPSTSIVSRVPDSVMDVDFAPSAQPSLSSARPGRKLKRRAGVGATQSTFLSDIDTSIAYAEQAQKEEKKTRTRELYEELNRETMSMQPAFKRTRTVDPETQRPEFNHAELMQVDEENDFVSRALRSVKTVKNESVPKRTRSSRPVSPVKPPEPIEEEEEEPEPEPELQERKPKKKPSKELPKPNSQVDKDEKFLQAISKNSRSKKEMDELDKEFNQLRIPKPNTKAKPKATWEPPDYSVLKDFDDDVRGNFIEVVRANLFRKDVPKTAAPANDGRPNFKKFKKKNILRREPVTLIISEQHAQAEMGEPYWQVETTMTQKKTQGRSQATQSQRRPTGLSFDDDDDDEPPIQRSKRAPVLTQIPEDDDDDIVPLRPPTIRRRGATPTQRPDTLKRTRAGSSISEVSSHSTTPAPRTRAPRGTQAKPMLVDDSDDEEIFVTAATGPGTSRSSRPRGAAVGRSAKTSTIEGETMSRPTRSTQATRRKLLDDDDDEVEVQVVQKKRRVR